MKCIIPKEDCHIAMNIVNSRAATKIESIISKSQRRESGIKGGKGEIEEQRL